MNRFILADPARCLGCSTCMAACSVAHEEEGLLSAPRLTVARDADRVAPVACRHCETMPCAGVCPAQAISRVDSLVRVDEALCLGCGLCGLACPFGAIEHAPACTTPDATKATSKHGILPEPSALQAKAPPALPSDRMMQGFPTHLCGWLAHGDGTGHMVAAKCDLCFFRGEKGPACVEMCPTGAIVLVDESILVDISAAKNLATLCGIS